MNLIMKTKKLQQHTIAILGIGLFLVLQTGSSLAQQIPNFSMYNMNHYLVNPAATGTTDRVPVSLSYRKMWAGMENTPSLQYLSGNMLVGQDMGVGAKLFNSQIGPLRNWIGRNVQLSPFSWFRGHQTLLRIIPTALPV